VTEVVIALVAKSTFKRASRISPLFDCSEADFMATTICTVPPLVDEYYEARLASRSIRFCKLGTVWVSDFRLMVIVMQPCRIVKDRYEGSEIYALLCQHLGLHDAMYVEWVREEVDSEALVIPL
jgi:hypothetical protein